MPEFCNCGAQLAPGSLFCHKCGKPQREIVKPEAFEPEAPAPPSEANALPPHPPAPPAAPAPTFRNPVAVRIALLVAVAAMFLNWLPLINWLGAGFFSVFFYRKKTRYLMDVSAGVRLGWITGIMMFTMWSVIFTAFGVTGQFSKLVREQMKNIPANDPYVQQLSAFLQSLPGILIMLAMGFVFITMLSMAGGALGAKMVGRD